MAAIQTTLTLKDDISKRLKSIEKRVNSLTKTMNNFNKGIVKSTKDTNELSKRVEKVSTATKKLATASKNVNNLNKSLKNTRTTAFQAKSGVDELTRSVKRLAMAYLGVMSIGSILDTADTITGATNKLSTVYRMENPDASNAETKAVVQGQMDDIFASAQRSRSDYNATMQNVGKMLINAGDTFEGNLDKAIAFNELMAKSYSIGGASQKEQDSSMYQLIQALGSGTLAGDELRSVREGAQVAYKYIEEYAQKLYDTETSLKDLAAKGLITSDIVTNAILENADAINSMFNDTQVTFEQTWVSMRNNFVKAFEPVLQKLTTLLNNQDFQEMLEGITSAFVTASNLVLQALDWIATAWKEANDFVQKHSDILANVLLPTIVTLITAWLAWIAVTAIQAMIANWSILLIVGAILAVIAALTWLITEFEGFANWLGSLIGGLVATIWNFVVWLINGVWASVVRTYNFIANLVNIFGNMFTNGFAGFFASVGKLFLSFVEVIVDGLMWIAGLFDDIFGTNLNEGLGNFQDKVNELIEAELGPNEKVYMKKIEAVDVLDKVDPNEWSKVGGNIGTTIHDKLNEAKDWLGNSLNTGASPFPNGNDWDTTIKNALDGSNTGDNIGNIADSIELTKEDLEYLRELAEMEAINRFTTAEIKVDMSNYNTINGENDLDGLVEKLSEKIEEEMHIVAEGTY